MEYEHVTIIIPNLASKTVFHAIFSAKRLESSRSNRSPHNITPRCLEYKINHLKQVISISLLCKTFINCARICYAGVT